MALSFNKCISNRWTIAKKLKVCFSNLCFCKYRLEYKKYIVHTAYREQTQIWWSARQSWESQTVSRPPPGTLPPPRSWGGYNPKFNYKFRYFIIFITSWKDSFIRRGKKYLWHFPFFTPSFVPFIFFYPWYLIFMSDEDEFSFNPLLKFPFLVLVLFPEMREVCFSHLAQFQ